MILYTVTTIAEAGRGFGGCRQVAICTTKHDARRIVTRNAADIHERSYTWAVIEPVTSDCVYGGLEYWDEVEWYEWQGDPDTGAYKLKDATPEEFLATIGFYEAGPIRNQLAEAKLTMARVAEDLNVTADHIEGAGGIASEYDKRIAKDIRWHARSLHIPGYE